MSLVYTAPDPRKKTSILFQILGANMNSTADQAFAPLFGFNDYILTRVIVTNASAALSPAAGGVYTSASKTGTIIVPAAQVYSALTASAPVLDLTFANTDRRSGVPILSLTTPKGSAATADFYIEGVAVS
jgi:hypothetical protein